MLHIRRNNHTPLFVQIGDGIRQQIVQGTLKVGDVLPSEREYAEQLRVSRMTVRAAQDVLVHEGLLVRQHGRGTIVAATKINRSTSAFMSFSEDMHARPAFKLTGTHFSCSSSEYGNNSPARVA